MAILAGEKTNGIYSVDWSKTSDVTITEIVYGLDYCQRFIEKITRTTNYQTGEGHCVIEFKPEDGEVWTLKMKISNQEWVKKNTKEGIKSED